MVYARSNPNHSGKLPGDPDCRWQTLSDHLAGVSDLAMCFALQARPGDEDFALSAKWAGLLHDLGKYREEFQQYLKRERSSSAETAHAVYGAAASCFSMDNVAGAFAIAGHHTGLHDASDLQGLLSGNKLQ
ncbi:MAG: CRISPR-associated endonuclease Cas3'' [Chloroflexota bacterium]